MTRDQKMNGQFRLARDIASDPLPFGSLRWLSNPAATGTKQLAIIEAKLNAGEGHAFHQHPEQEELVFVLDGLVEQWIGEECKILGPGDAAFIPPGVVHASYTSGDRPSKLLAIFGPSVGAGFTAIELADKAPWKDLRQRNAP